MTQPPTAPELLAVLQAQLRKQVLPVLAGLPRLAAQTESAIQLLEIAERETLADPQRLYDEWKRMDFVQGEALPPPTLTAALDALQERRRQLSAEIRAGRYETQPGRAALIEHLFQNLHERLAVDNPAFLLALLAEDNVRPD